MASEEVKGAIVPGQQSSMNGEVAETTVTSGNLGVRTGAAVVAENGPPPLQEQALGELPHTPTPSPSLGLHGSKPSSVESRAPEEKQPAPLSADMVVPVKPGDSADAKQSEVTDPIHRPKTPSGSPRPPSSNGNAPAPPSPVERPLSKEEDSVDMGAEGSKFGPGKFRKASSTDIHPLEEKVSVAKRSASSSSGFLSKNGRNSVSGTDSSNGHREFVQPVAEEQEKGLAGGRPPSRQDTSPLPEKEEEKRKSPPLGPLSPVPTASKSPIPTRVSSKPSSPDLMVHPVSSTKMNADLPAGSKAKEDVHTKTSSPDLKEKERIIADSKKLDADKGKIPSADDKKAVKSPSPDLLKTKSNGSLRASPEPPHQVLKSSEGVAISESLKGDQERKIPGSDNGGHKSPQPPKSKTPSPDLRNATVIKSVSPDIIKKGTQESHSPEPVKEKPLLEQMKGSTPSPEPVRVKSSSPDVVCSSPSQLSTMKPSSPDLRKETSKTIDDSNVIKYHTPHPSGTQQETKNVLKQKVSSPEIGVNKPPSPDAAMERFRSESSLNQPIVDSKFKTKSPDLLPKTPSPDIPKSKSVSPEPSKDKPITSEPPRSKSSTPEPSKQKTSSINGLDTDSRRPASRLSNISDNGVKGSPTPPNTKSPSPELGRLKSDSPDLPMPKGKSPSLPSPKSSSPEPDKYNKTGVDHRSLDSKIPEQEVKKLSEDIMEKYVTSKQETDILKKPSALSPEPDRIQTPSASSRSKPSTPEPLKSKSQSQESVKSEEQQTASPKPLQKQTSNQKLTRKSPSPDIGHRTSNPPSLPPSPEPLNLKKAPSPDINYTKSASPTQISKDHPSTASSATSGVDMKVSESSDKAAAKLTPSPDLSNQKISTEGHKSPTDVVIDSGVSRAKVSEIASEGKISPVKKADEIISKTPLMKKSDSPEPVKSPSPLPPKSASPKVSREDSSGSKKSPSPTSLKPASPETFLPSDTSEGISSLPPKSATPDSTKSMSSGSPKPSSPMIPKSPSPTADKPTKPPSPTIPKSPSPTQDKLSKSPSPVIPKSSSPTADKLAKSPSPILPKSPSPTKDKPPKSPSPTTDKLPKSPSPVISKSPSPSTDRRPSPLSPKSPSPTADKLQKPPSPEGKPISPALSKSPASPDKVKSPSPIAKKTPSPELLERKTSDKALTLEREKIKTMTSPEPTISSAEKTKGKSPSPELDQQKGKTTVQPEQSKRPGSRQGVSPEFVLSPSEDSGRTSASPEHFERKSSTPPKPVSPLPSSTPLTDRTPTSPTDSRRAGDARTPDAKITATYSPTSEVGDEASSISRTESGSARASSAEAATPDEEAKVAGTPLDEIQDGDVKKKDEKDKDEEKAGEESKKKKPDSSKPGTPSRTPRTPRSVVPSPRTPRRTTPRSKRKDGGHEKISDIKGKSMETKPSTNGEVCSPTKRSPTKTPGKKSPGTPTAVTSSPARPPLKSPAKSKTPPALAAAPTPESDKKKVPMNKVQVGTAASPNLKAVRSKIGSLDNASYRPGGGKVKIENRKLDFSKAAPKIAAKNDAYVPGGGDKKIQQVKLNWSAKPKVGSLDNATYKPGGGEKKIETVKLDFKEKAKPKVGSKDNIKHAPGGGTVKKTSGTKDDPSSDIESQKLEFKAQSKVGSMDNVKHKPGGGERKIFDDKNYLKQVGGSSSKASSEGRASGAQSPIPPMSPQRFSEENSVEES